MFRNLLQAVSREVSGERALDSVRDLARFHRIQASPGYDQAAEWLRARLAQHGYQPEVETVPGDGRTRFLGQVMPEGWECSRARATLIDGSQRRVLCNDSEALSVVQRSLPARGRFRLVAIEGGAERDHYAGVDVENAVVLVRDGAHPSFERAVLERGAAGLLCDGRRLIDPVRDAFEDPDQIAYTSFWWAGDQPRGWGFVVSPRAGALLRERLGTGARLELEVDLETRRFDTAIPLVSAALPGASGREVLVLSHLCHPRPSANDNASGASALLETARVLRVLAGRGELPPLEHGIRFLWMPELTGTLAWLGLDESRARRLVAALNLDMVGEDQEQCGSTLLLERPPCFAASFAETLLERIRWSALDWVNSYAGPGHVPATRIAQVPYSGGSDHAVLTDPMIGVPCPMLIQWPDRYYHSSHDTPDKCDPRSLALAVRCAATYAGFLATAGSAERRWVASLTMRDAQTRVLRALDDDAPARAVARERERAGRALASLARLGVAEHDIAAAGDAWQAFLAREAPAQTSDPGSAAPLGAAAGAPGAPAAPGGRRPRRLQRGMLDFQRHLIEGYAQLPAADREAWRALERTHPDAATAFDLAWFACDGHRTLDEIAALVELETGRPVPSLLAFFEWTERLGLARLEAEREECGTAARTADTR